MIDTKLFLSNDHPVQLILFDVRVRKLDRKYLQVINLQYYEMKVYHINKTYLIPNSRTDILLALLVHAPYIRSVLYSYMPRIIICIFPDPAEEPEIDIEKDFPLTGIITDELNRKTFKYWITVI